MHNNVLNLLCYFITSGALLMMEVETQYGQHCANIRRQHLELTRLGS